MRTSHDNALVLPGLAGYRAGQAARLAAGIVRRMHGRLRLWNARLQERAFLAGLGDFELSRLGLTPGQRDAETGKAFWEH
jgi:uncharacterized protein YjiS (DUF1127 family)